MDLFVKKAVFGSKKLELFNSEDNPLLVVTWTSQCTLVGNINDLFEHEIDISFCGYEFYDDVLTINPHISLRFPRTYQKPEQLVRVANGCLYVDLKD